MDVVRIGVGDLTTNARPATNRPGARWIPFALAATLVLSGLAMLAIRLDAPDDGSLVSAWSTMGVRVDMAAAAGSRGLATGDLIRGIGGVDLTDGLGNLARPTPGQALDYQVARNGATRSVSVVVGPTQLTPLLVQGWGNLVFVCSLAALAAALRLRRPQEPTTVPLLIASACLLGSTVAFTVGTPAVATATGGPELWVYLLDTGVVYSFAWGAVLVFTLQLSGSVTAPTTADPSAGVRRGTGAVLCLDRHLRPVRKQSVRLDRAELRWSDRAGGAHADDDHGARCRRVCPQRGPGDEGSAALDRHRRRRVSSDWPRRMARPESGPRASAPAVRRDRSLRAAVRRWDRGRAPASSPVRYRASGEPFPGQRHPDRAAGRRLCRGRRDPGQWVGALRVAGCRPGRGRCGAHTRTAAYGSPSAASIG